ncbi:CNH domain-containing protein [Entamoeba marina]
MSTSSLQLYEKSNKNILILGNEKGIRYIFYEKPMHRASGHLYYETPAISLLHYHEPFQFFLTNKVTEFTSPSRLYFFKQDLSNVEFDEPGDRSVITETTTCNPQIHQIPFESKVQKYNEGKLVKEVKNVSHQNIICPIENSTEHYLVHFSESKSKYVHIHKPNGDEVKKYKLDKNIASDIKFMVSFGKDMNRVIFLGLGDFICYAITNSNNKSDDSLKSVRFDFKSGATLATTRTQNGGCYLIVFNGSQQHIFSYLFSGKFKYEMANQIGKI